MQGARAVVHHRPFLVVQAFDSVAHRVLPPFASGLNAAHLAEAVRFDKRLPDSIEEETEHQHNAFYGWGGFECGQGVGE